LKGRKVGVMDMDLEGPGLHVIFGLDPYELPFTLNDVLTNGAQPEQATVKMNERLHLHRGEIYFAPASVKVEEILKSLRSGFELDSFSNAIKKLTEKFGLDYLLVDTHPGLEDDTLLAMGVCNNLVVVSRLDQQDMFGTGVLAEVARTLEKPVHLVLNMIPSAMSPSEASKVIDKIGANFKVQVLGWLPYSEEITNSLSKSVFILDNPRHPITKRFNELATRLEGLSGMN
jgi:MinD-like ATPase involved in chromosome partitioning or flagellar assembly